MPLIYSLTDRIMSSGLNVKMILWVFTNHNKIHKLLEPVKHKKGFDCLDCIEDKLFQQSSWRNLVCVVQHQTKGKSYENNSAISHRQLEGDLCPPGLPFLPCSFHGFQVSENSAVSLRYPSQKSISVISEALLKPLRTQPALFLLLAPCLLELFKPVPCSIPAFLRSKDFSSRNLRKAHAAHVLLEESSWHGAPQPAQGNLTTFFRLDYSCFFSGLEQAAKNELQASLLGLFRERYCSSAKGLSTIGSSCPGNWWSSIS